VVERCVAEHLLPLQTLRRGECGRIGQLVGQPEMVHRLAEMGFRIGVQVQMLQPGTPCIVRVGDDRVCIRNNESLGILIHPGAAH